MSLGRVAFLTNILPPYRKPVLLELARRCSHLKVFLSQPMEANRSWDVDWSGLDVQLQHTYTFTQRWRHVRAGGERVFVHLPLDTLSELHEFRPELIISVEMGLRTVLSALYRQFNPSTRLLVWADYSESTEQGRGSSRLLVRRTLKRFVDGFIVNGASGKRYIQSLGVAPERIFVVPYATDTRLFGAGEGREKEYNQHHLLYVGQLIQRKGLPSFLEALTRWANEHPSEQVTFTIAGNGPLRSQLEAARTPVNIQLNWLGSVPYESLPAVYRKATVFVLPAFAETWALVVNEAMASGLPVLGSIRAQAVEELVTDGETGWLFEPENADSVYGALDRCLSATPIYRAEMGRRAESLACTLTPEFTVDLIGQAAQHCLGILPSPATI
jgi:glycosyltransferase involved in cell wall biosynthesis